MDELVLFLHQRTFYILAPVAAIAAIWGLILFFTKRPANKYWHGSLIATVALGCLQALLGIYMVVVMHATPGGGANYYLHYVYGAIAALAIPAALTYTSGGKNARRDMLIFSLAALVIAAVAARAWMTGPK